MPERGAIVLRQPRPLRAEQRREKMIVGDFSRALIDDHVAARRWVRMRNELAQRLQNVA